LLRAIPGVTAPWMKLVDVLLESNLWATAPTTVVELDVKYAEAV
jgi:hypothetical protein